MTKPTSRDKECTWRAPKHRHVVVGLGRKHKLLVISATWARRNRFVGPKAFPTNYLIWSPFFRCGRRRRVSSLLLFLFASRKCILFNSSTRAAEQLRICFFFFVFVLYARHQERRKEKRKKTEEGKRKGASTKSVQGSLIVKMFPSLWSRLWDAAIDFFRNLSSTSSTGKRFFPRLQGAYDGKP